MADDQADHLIKRAAEAAKAPLIRTSERHLQVPYARRAFSFPFMSLVLALAVGCSSNKTQTISESYVQSVVNLNNGLVAQVGDVTRLSNASSALQQADSLIRQAVKRRNKALSEFSEINADFEATPEQLKALATTNQAANDSDVETLVGLISTFQSALTAEELAAVYQERAEFAMQTLTLFDER